MILPDVNVLIYALKRGHPQQLNYKEWLDAAVARGEEILLLDVVLSGFLRIVTHPRASTNPMPIAEAFAVIGMLRGLPRARTALVGDTVWEEFARLASSDRGIVGNLVPDAYLASVAMSHGARLATSDRGFARFRRLDWFDPLEV